MRLYEELLHAKPFFLIAGPCVIEDDDTMHQIADKLVSLTSERGIKLIFKASYKKANRTSETSYSGPGMKAGLKILADLKKQYGFPILSDVHETGDVKATAEVCDIVQIPAFLSRQTELIHAAASTTAENNFQIMLTERGTSFGYHNLVVDFRSFAIMRSSQYPVIYDVTHSMQKPSVNRSSGGTPEYAAMMARAAIATGMVNGLFIETHPAPMEALSDSASMLALGQMELVLDDCIKIWEAINNKS